MPSFDIVSRLDFQEIDNAISNCLREMGQRYDFKNSNTPRMPCASPPFGLLGLVMKFHPVISK